MRLPEVGQTVTLTSDENPAPRDVTVRHSHGLARLYDVVAPDPITGGLERATVAIHHDGRWWLVREFEPLDNPWSPEG